ncbi:hypothetical protein Q8A67_021211 [Cirrhinus molitorella]|uniref:Uncharacterized protein n=1 Tax=Cirrhinus molitorella TaxID=172907 RepID=A0AA88P6H7_9TELE|nr:hypothetical protein Q8A67_021211 [Cirrhinus molitorella]
MSAKFRNCRRNLAAALDQAAEELPSLSSSSPNIVSSFHNYSLSRTSQDDMNEDFKCCTRPGKLQDLCEFLTLQSLDDLVAKLEFENELNCVYSSPLRSKNPDQGENSAGCWVHNSKEEYSFLLDMVLEIEQDIDFTADCDVSFLELNLHLSP